MPTAPWVSCLRKPEAFWSRGALLGNASSVLAPATRACVETRPLFSKKNSRMCTAWAQAQRHLAPFCLPCSLRSAFLLFAGTMNGVNAVFALMACLVLALARTASTTPVPGGRFAGLSRSCNGPRSTPVIKTVHAVDAQAVIQALSCPPVAVRLA
jgi:hypothetical protein